MSWPAARAEGELELEGAGGMGMGDVAQQSGHEGGEMGHGGARVYAAAEGGDVEGRPTCCVCMEPWTDSGAHRICCIPCGHVYGRSCLEGWLSRGGSTSAKCPQCGKRFALENIINLYAPGNLWDGCHIQAPVTSGPSGSEGDLRKQVLDILHELANIEKEHGVHFDEIVKRFKLPERKIWDAIMDHVDMGNIYCTIDEFHFKSVFINDDVQQTYYQQRVLPFQAPVTSGPSGSEGDLRKQVLDILHEPVNIEKEHGVHFDEIVKQFKLPERKIWDAIMDHVDMGNIYFTIDEFHFKSVFITDDVQQTYYQQSVLPFQGPVTSEPSGSESDLCRQVLDILHEPANLEKEHGVHFEEIVKRFKLPKRNILWSSLSSSSNTHRKEQRVILVANILYGFICYAGMLSCTMWMRGLFTQQLMTFTSRLAWDEEYFSAWHPAVQQT